MANEKLRKVAPEFRCEECDYKCSNKFNYNKHLATRKHLATSSTNETSQIVAYTCANCNNTYKHQSSLCKHKRTCAATVVSQPIVSPIVVCPPVV